MPFYVRVSKVGGREGREGPLARPRKFMVIRRIVIARETEVDVSGARDDTRTFVDQFNKQPTRINSHECVSEIFRWNIKLAM